MTYYNLDIEFKKQDKIEKENLSNVEESDFNIVISGLKKEILAYRQGNMETRKTPEPAYFKNIDDDSIRNQVKKI